MREREEREEEEREEMEMEGKDGREEVRDMSIKKSGHHSRK